MNATAPLCECSGRGCWCETEPRAAVFSVQRDGRRINVCDRCDMTEDKDSVLLSEAPADPDWFEFHNNLALLYAWLSDRDEAPEVVEFLEKPWKWTPEWQQRIEAIRVQCKRA